MILTVAFLAIAPTFWIIASRASDPTVQIVVVSGAVLGLFGLFATVVFVIRRLGIFAILESTHVLSYKRMDLAAKNRPSISPTPAIADPDLPLQITESSTVLDGEDK